MTHGGDILIAALRAHGADRVFTVPGESFLAALDALAGSGVQTIVCRHEGAAAMMAEADAKLTGRPGIVFVTRGPGACNASAGLHVAMQDGTPLLCLVGQIARADRDRGAFQEVDFPAFFVPLVKWAAEIDDAARLGEYVRRAMRVAMSGRPGPVVLSLPEDMLSGPGPSQNVAPSAMARTAPHPADIAEARRILAAARRPLVVVGGSLWSDAAAQDLARWATESRLPLAASFRRQDMIDNRAPCYAGDLGVGMNPALGARLRAADAILALGCRLGDSATAGYTLRDPAADGQGALIHVFPDAAEIGRVWRTDLGIAADPRDVVAALAAGGPLDRAEDAMTGARDAYEAWQIPRPTPGAVRLEDTVAWLSRTLPDDAILTNGAGNYAAFLHRYYRFRRHGTQLAPTSGSMGYGLPAAIAASLRHPGRCVVALAGDGCFQMTGAEIATALQHGAAPIVIVCDNGRYGTIRMHQERTYPGRVHATDLANPDFAALARAHGAHGETVSRQTDFPAAFARARAAGRLALIHLSLDPRMLSTGADLPE